LAVFFFLGAAFFGAAFRDVAFLEADFRVDVFLEALAGALRLLALLLVFRVADFLVDLRTGAMSLVNPPIPGAL
jgi:uncharacterized protein (DUF2236 family)